MKKDIKEILTYTITPEIGLGKIHFGISKDKLFEEYNIDKYISSSNARLKFNTMAEGGGLELYLFEESIILSFNGEDNYILVSIFLQNNFKGKYLNQITIGTPFTELYTLKQATLSYDDDLFFPDGHYNFYVELDIDDCKEKLNYNYLSDSMIYGKEKEMRTCKIESFFFRKDIEDIQNETHFMSSNIDDNNQIPDNFFK